MAQRKARAPISFEWGSQRYYSEAKSVLHLRFQPTQDRSEQLLLAFLSLF